MPSRSFSGQSRKNTTRRGRCEHGPGSAHPTALHYTSPHSPSLRLRMDLRAPIPSPDLALPRPKRQRRVGTLKLTLPLSPPRPASTSAAASSLTTSPRTLSSRSRRRRSSSTRRRWWGRQTIGIMTLRLGTIEGRAGWMGVAGCLDERKEELEWRRTRWRH